MKAALIESFGGRDQIQVRDVPKPSPGPGELLIRVMAAGVNPVDVKIRQGLLQGRLPHEFPLILGWDAAGVVEEIGGEGTRFRRGDEVMTYCRKPVLRDGAYAEYVAVDARHVTLKPKVMSFEEAASLPLSALTAYQCLFDSAKLCEGERVLIHAAAGGVGTFAVQLAKDRGAIVYGTASRRHHEYLLELGVDTPIDYTTGDFAEALPKEGVDVVLDCVGGETQRRSTTVLRRGGRMVSLLAWSNEARSSAVAHGVDAQYVFVSPNEEELAKIAALADRRRLQTHLEMVLPLDEAAKAHALIESGHTCGKIVLTILP